MDGSNVSLIYFLPTQEWDLLRFYVERKEIKYACCPFPYVNLEFTVVMQRKPVKIWEIFRAKFIEIFISCRDFTSWTWLSLRSSWLSLILSDFSLLLQVKFSIIPFVLLIYLYFIFTNSVLFSIIRFNSIFYGCSAKTIFFIFLNFAF